MALCGNHQPADVVVPFEHAQLLTRLRALLYKDSLETRELQLAETARVMSEVLSLIPGLVAELADFAGEQSGPTHLRLIFSANELALLPFELANAASAFPGAGQSLALQAQVPMCITREVRRVSYGPVEWPTTPKILVAVSSAGGAVPADAHLLALRKVIEPWMFHYDEGNQAEWQQRIEEHLTVIPRASVETLLQACASGVYTHVHLLAHGVPVDRDDGRHYGLALHGSQDPDSIDIVDGARLATLLRPNAKAKMDTLVRPAVVTIAACDSGNIGSVIGAGASIAHSLHEAGIPLVIASQFPLSFAASVVMVQVLYDGLLGGFDPRLLLIDVRRQLKVRVPGTHDWASIVAYASFPPDLDRQLVKMRINRAARSIEAALNYADRITQSMWKTLRQTTSRRGTGSGTVTGTGQGPEKALVLDSAKEKLKNAMARMQAVLGSKDSERSLIYGLLASAEKRKAEIFWRAADVFAGSDTDRIGMYRDEALSSLEHSRDYYALAFQSARSESWALVQGMALTAVLDGVVRIKPDEWELARLLSEEDLKLGEPQSISATPDLRQRQAWAHSNLLELYLLHLLGGTGRPPLRDDHLEEVVRVAGRDATEIHSIRRQLSRYVEFFPEVRLEAAMRKNQVREPQWDAVVISAREMFSRLPEPASFS
jgi:hypothetical protein